MNIFQARIKRTVMFCKKIPYFSNMANTEHGQSDQIELLSKRCLGMIIIRLARTYNSSTDTFIMNEQPTKCTQFDTLNGKGIFDYFYNVFKHLTDLQLKDEELALFSTAVLFKPGKFNFTN